ncbi:hypothetical protein [Holophaga foetida]|uniref:hypothetical protein n=1 Tax=Holophaga foetida TaxID=35839 RepID=UPI0002472A4C|nr:hypothetical protein [Holophaga foetida]
MGVDRLIHPASTFRVGFAAQGRGFGFTFPFSNATSKEAVEADLRALEAQGLPVEDLANAVMDGFHMLFPYFLRLGAGIRERKDLSPDNPQVGLWTLVVLKDGWRVLEHLGTRSEDMVAYLLTRWPPSAWLDDADLIRIPESLRKILRPEGLHIGPGSALVDLTWLPCRLACSLTVEGPRPGLLLPKHLEVWGDVSIRGVDGVRPLDGLSCPRRTLTIQACSGLERIELPAATAIRISQCPQLTRIQGKLTASLEVEDCPGLESIDAVFPRDALPPPALTVRRCESLRVIGRPTSKTRMCGGTSLVDCPNLTTVNVNLFRGKKIVLRCPKLVV